MKSVAYSKLSEGKKAHTKYFCENEFTKLKLPAITNPSKQKDPSLSSVASFFVTRTAGIASVEDIVAEADPVEEIGAVADHVEESYRRRECDQNISPFNEDISDLVIDDLTEHTPLDDMGEGSSNSSYDGSCSLSPANLADPADDEVDIFEPPLKRRKDNEAAAELYINVNVICDEDITNKRDTVNPAIDNINISLTLVGKILDGLVCANVSCLTQRPADSLLQQCSGCSAVAYCGRRCQAVGWAAHKHICKNMNRAEWRTKVKLITAMLKIFMQKNNLNSLGDINKNHESSVPVFNDNQEVFAVGDSDASEEVTNAPEEPGLRSYAGSDDFVASIARQVLHGLGVTPGVGLQEAIADAVTDGLQKGPNDDDDELTQAKWLEGEETLSCETCLSLETFEIPRALKGLRRGQFGIVLKQNRSKKAINRGKKEHELNALHIWCFKQVQERDTNVLKDKKKNEEVAKLIATNVALCLITGGSAKDFVRLNDKDNLTQGVDAAQKNDGRQEFFKYRELFFLELTESVKHFFKRNIKSFSVTLDKITNQRVPYCAILTYFFWEGRICILLNSLHRMTSEEGDSEGTARMVATVLMETLGLSMSALKARCHHFCYDGVYATREERTTNNGLALTDFYAELLRLQRGDITGNHDMSHNLQLVFSDVFKHDKTGDKEMKKLSKEVFDVMTEYNNGPGGSAFHEAALRLNHVVYSNKSRQETRFDRSDLRGFQSYMFNLPTFFNIQGEIMQECNRVGDTTGAKEALKYMEKLSDGKRLAKITGYSYLLNEYSACSVQSQHARTFPTTTLAHIMKLENTLDQL